MKVVILDFSNGITVVRDLPQGLDIEDFMVELNNQGVIGKIQDCEYMVVRDLIIDIQP